MAIFTFKKSQSSQRRHLKSNYYENSSVLDGKTGPGETSGGGWYHEIYLSDDIIPQTGLPFGFRGERSFATSIYFLLEGTDFSTFHRIKSDEIWHYYTGTSAIEILSLEKGKMKSYLVGTDPERGETFQVIVPKNTWFAARLLNPEGYALAGCTVSPGFHYDDFELADDGLLKEYPELRDEIVPLLK